MRMEETRELLEVFLKSKLETLTVTKNSMAGGDLTYTWNRKQAAHELERLKEPLPEPEPIGSLSLSIHPTIKFSVLYEDLEAVRIKKLIGDFEIMRATV